MRAVASPLPPPPTGRSARAIRVMIVDDSLTVRTILKRMVESDPALSVIGTASTAETALALLREVPADVVLLDLEMPGMGGLAALPAMLALVPDVQVLVVSALTEAGAETSLKALAMGAADTMLKPQPGEFTEDYRSALIARVRALGAPLLPEPESGRAPPPAMPCAADLAGLAIRRPEIIAIGASTGGIHALGQLLGQFDRSLTQPICITQHLPAAFMPVFARQIAAACGRPARLAEDGLEITPGEVVIASGAGHLTLRRVGEALMVQLSHQRVASGCRPSVDPMLASLAEVCGNRALGIILSGMGADGLAGARRLAASGGTILAQDAGSSAVWGMPGAVTRAGLARLVAPPAALGAAVMRCAAAPALR